MSKSDNLGDFLLDLKTTIQAKTGTSGTLNPQDFSTQIASIPSGDPAPKKYFFYDYDGTLLYSYTRAELEALTALPAVPTTHTQFSSGEWNWTLQDLKDYTDAQIVGANYTPADGKTVIGISIRNANELTVTCLLDGERDWGDGTVDSNTSHTYSAIGNYEIKISDTSQTNTALVFGQTSSSTNDTVKYIYYNKSGISKNAFQYCKALETISISPQTTYFLEYSFNSSAIKFVAFPKTIATYSTSSLFFCCYNLERCSFPKSVSEIKADAFRSSGIFEFTAHNDASRFYDYSFYECKRLYWVQFSKKITSIGMNAFQNCTALNDISSLSECNLSTLGTSAFSGCNSITVFDISNSSNIVTLGQDSLANTNAMQTIVLPFAAIGLATAKGSSTTWSALRKIIIKTDDGSAFGLSANTLYAFEGVFFSDGQPYPLNGYQKFAYSPIIKAVVNNRYGNTNGFEYSSLSEIVTNGSPTEVPQYCFRNTMLKEFTMKNTVTTVGQYAFSNCKAKKIIMSSALTSIGLAAFSTCTECLLFDFSNCGQIPSLYSTNCFNSINDKAMIVVPDSLYESWIGATNWSADSIKNYIYKASEVNI